MIKIRKATIKDKEIIAKIEYLSGYKWKMNKKEELKEADKILNSENKFAYILEDSNKELGYFVLSFKNKICEIEFFSLIKSFHRKGLGSLMMEKIISLAKRKRCKKIELTVWAKNFKAIGLYNKYGFFTTQIKRKHYPNGDGKIRMVKII